MQKLILAPMAAISHEALRRAVFRFGGCDEYYSEMIHAGSLLAGGHFEKYYIRTGPEPEKMVWQLTDSKPAALVQAAAQVSALGGIGVDINMGCCAPDIYRYGAGIAWMLKPHEETASMLRAVRAAIPPEMRLSAKIRLGDEDFTDDGFFAFCDMLSESGVTRICLHPRTKKEKYRKPPRYEYVRRLAEHSLEQFCGRVSVVLNGGVHDAQSFAAANNAVSHDTAAKIDGTMIGRAAIQKPWIFAVLKSSITTPQIDLLEIALCFLDDLEECQPREFWKSRAQRFFTYFSDNVRFAHHLRTKLLNASSLDDSRALLREYFMQAPDDRFLQG